VLQSLEKDTVTIEALASVTERRHELLEDRWILSRLNHLILNVTALWDEYQFGEVERQIHDFVWGEFCDWYIEMAKSRIGQPSSPMPVLIYVLETTLRLLHPFMPFITEEIWQNLRDRIPQGYLKTESLIIAPYPIAHEKAIDSAAERVMDAVIETVRAIRNVRAEHNVVASKWIEARVYADDITSDIAAKSETIELLSRARPLTVLNRKERTGKEENAVVVVLKETDVVLPLAGMIDLSAEKKRLEDEIANIGSDIARLESRLNDAAFTSKAPAAVVEKERGRLQSQRDKLTRLNQELSQLTQ